MHQEQENDDGGDRAVAHDSAVVALDNLPDEQTASDNGEGKEKVNEEVHVGTGDACESWVKGAYRRSP